MKKLITVVLAIVFGFLFWSRHNDSAGNPEPAKLNFLDGPDKAHARDYSMMNDPEIGNIPHERIITALNQIKYSRTKASRDFRWVNQPTRVSGRSRSLLVNPDGSMLAGSITGGLWRNPDFKNDAEWTPVDGLEHNSISCIVRDPIENATLYAGTGESQTAFVNYRESTGVGNGIFKSTDNGVTWSSLGATSGFSYVNDIVVRDEGGTSVVYAGVASGEYRGRIFYPEGGDGLFRSVDGGTSWMQVLPNIEGETEAYAVSDIELTEDNTLYVGSMRNLEIKGGGRVLKSLDGINWEVFSDYQTIVDEISSNTGGEWQAGRVVLKSAPSNPNHIYGVFMCGTENGLGQFRDFETSMLQTADAGASWT